MILKKVVTNGQETFIPVSREEAKIAIGLKEELVFTDEDEKEDLYDEIEEELDEQEEMEEEEEIETDESEEESFKDFGKTISRMVNENLNFTFNPKRDKSRDSSANPKSKMAQLMKVLPFLDASDLHEFVEEIIQGEESLEAINIMAFLPFLNQEDCDALFMKALQDGNHQFDPVQIAPFVSEKSLSLVVDQFIAGQFQQVPMDALYPFLSSQDVKRVFKYILAKKEEKK